ncbi:hypothetical protein [Streptomyces sp. NPDC055709]
MTSPAVDALSQVLFDGRRARLHVLFDGHPTAHVLGPQAPEQFATVILRRVPTGTRGRLAPIGGTAHPTQVLALTGAEATARATGEQTGTL